MAFIASRKSRGKAYWSIVESRRVDGKPRNFILEYLGTADSLLHRLRTEDNFSIKSFSHGDTTALLNAAIELNIVNIINKHIPANKKGGKIIRNNCTVGASVLLAAIGRACHPTSKMGWYDWCKQTSLEYSLKASFKNHDSQHFWDQMDALPKESIQLIEEEIIANVTTAYDLKLDCLLYDTTNFFSFIASDNKRCDLPQRGKNKQKRYDLRQIGMALLVSRQDQFPLFHKTYQGNKNDSKLFKEIFPDLINRIKSINSDVTDITLVFDKGNNSKTNFKMIDDDTNKIHYVGGLVSSHFKELIKEANSSFDIMKIMDEEIPVYRIKKTIWGSERTCVITVSTQLKEGQIRGIHQHLEKKYKQLEELKQQLENPKKRKVFSREELEERLKEIIKGQFVDEILKYELIALKKGDHSFSYFLDSESFDNLKTNILGRRILITNRHDWSNDEILLAYRGQSKVEYAFRTFKNPYHMAVRPQYHWTDQKIEVHVLICIIGYLLTIASYVKAGKVGYKKNIENFMEDLKSIRLACRTKNKSKKIKYQLEKISSDLKNVSVSL
ncbi:IS1634 family transposase, partial [Candidatus Woesearchaeota archaeon]|nr:IS1634 family transposase [Candidatus Woesearchaeota archaeon]